MRMRRMKLPSGAGSQLQYCVGCVVGSGGSVWMYRVNEPSSFRHGKCSCTAGMPSALRLIELSTRFKSSALYMVTDQKAWGLDGGNCPASKLSVYRLAPFNVWPAPSTNAPA